MTFSTYVNQDIYELDYILNQRDLTIAILSLPHRKRERETHRDRERGNRDKT